MPTHKFDVNLTQKQQSILLGSLLGDGHISSNAQGRNSHFKKNQCGAHAEYLIWNRNQLESYSKECKTSSRIFKSKLVYKIEFKTICHPFFTNLRKKWYIESGVKGVNATKIIPRDIVLDELAIAIWFFDDGINDLVARRATFCTDCFSKKDNEFLISQLKLFNISSHVNHRNRIYVHAKSYKNLTDLIRPYCLWNCFKYKTLYRPSFYDEILKKNNEYKHISWHKTEKTWVVRKTIDKKVNYLGRFKNKDDAIIKLLAYVTPEQWEEIKIKGAYVPT